MKGDAVRGTPMTASATMRTRAQLVAPWAEKEPLGHWGQVDEFELFEKKPGEHGRQAAMPCECAKEPGRHGTQAACDVAPRAAEALPRSQGTQSSTEAPVELVDHVPAGHAVQP